MDSSYRLDIVRGLNRLLWYYASAQPDAASLEILAEMRELIAKAEHKHRGWPIVDPGYNPLDNDDDL